MNERIKELESQCWEPRQYGPPWFNSTKFAKLIVKECTAQILKERDNEGSWDDWDMGYNSGIRTAITAINEHFGVEE